MLTRRGLGRLAVACAILTARRAGAEAARIVVIQPVGPGSVSLAAPVERALSAFYTVKIEVAAQTPLPRAAYYPARGRYRAEKLLSELADKHPHAFRVIGLTAVDISTTKGNVADWGILGLASIDGRSSVLSSFRCRRSAKSPAHAAERLSKTAVHELGHTFGLEHCPTDRCLMHDGEGTVLTTDGEFDLCTSCRTRLAEQHLLRIDGTPPWPRP